MLCRCWMPWWQVAFHPYDSLLGLQSSSVVLQWMVLQWIPAYCSIPRIEEAYTLAKMGSKEEQVETIIKSLHKNTFKRRITINSTERNRWSFFVSELAMQSQISTCIIDLKLESHLNTVEGLETRQLSICYNIAANLTTWGLLLGY